MHARPFNVECSCRTNSSAGATLETLVHVSLNILGHSVHRDSPALEIANTTVIVFAALTLELHDHHTFPSWVNGGLEDIEGQVVVAH
jgi:hypothetical protein